MPKVTSKLQLTVPKAIADQYGIRPGDELQAIATKLLREGLSTDSIRIPHQAVLEFMAVVTRVRIGTEPLLTQAEARRETEELLDQFRILFPNTAVVRTALRGAASYQLPWF